VFKELISTVSDFTETLEQPLLFFDLLDILETGPTTNNDLIRNPLNP